MYWRHSVLETQCIGDTVYWRHSIVATKCIGGTVYWRHSVLEIVFWNHSVLETQSQCIGDTVRRRAECDSVLATL